MLGAGWFLDKVLIREGDNKNAKSYEFPCQRLILNVKYLIFEMDSRLSNNLYLNLRNN